MDLHGVISEFGSFVNLPQFSLDDRGMARLQLDGSIVIDFEYDANQNVLHLYSSIASASAAGGEAQLRLLLEANLFLESSLGTTFALDAGTGEFMACARLESEELDGKRLERTVERMAAAVEKVREKLSGLVAANSVSSETPISTISKGALHG
jgi:hypothetical protein